MAELCITGALRSTPSDALDAILNIRTLKQESVERATMAAIRLRDSGYWVSKPYGHSAILNSSRHVPTKTDYCMPNEHTETPFTVLIPKREEWENDTQGYAGALNFYTDGSKLPRTALKFIV